MGIRPCGRFSKQEQEKFIYAGVYQMDKGIELYKKFMEGLLENRTDLNAQNLREGKRVFPAVDEKDCEIFVIP